MKKPRERRKGGDSRSRLSAILGLLTVAAVLALIIVAIGAELGAMPSIQPLAPAPAPIASTTTTAATSPVAATLNPTIRIATWNVRDCAATDAVTKERISFHDRIAQTIQSHGLDIVAFQEIQADSGNGGDIALLSVALAKAGWAMPFTAVVDAKGSDDLAIFSRYKIVDQGSLLLPANADPWPRPGIYARISIGQTFLDVYGFHFKALGDPRSEEARKAQAKALAHYLKERYNDGLKTANIVLAGDFNTANPGDLAKLDSTLSYLRLAHDEDPANDLLDTNFTFKKDSPTFVDSRYSSVLDHILLSPGLAKGVSREKIFIFEALPGIGRIPTSDHHIVAVDLGL